MSRSAAFGISASSDTGQTSSTPVSDKNSTCCALKLRIGSIALWSPSIRNSPASAGSRKHTSVPAAPSAADERALI